MRVLFDIGHPAHVHLFKNCISLLKQRGHKVLVTCKKQAITHLLLRNYNIDYIDIGGKSDSIAGKIICQIQSSLKLMMIVQREKIDVALGSTFSVSHLPILTKAKSIILDDDDDVVVPLFVKFGHTFATDILSPNCLKRKSPKTIYYPGYHELAYLHPNRFTPDPSVLDKVGVKEGEDYFILRFNAFKAYHDIGEEGLSWQQKLELIQILKPLGRVFITSEREVREEFLPYKINADPGLFHSLLAYAKLFIGDSQTTVSEAAVLGIPALRCNSFAGRISYHAEEEGYGLVYSFLPADFDKLKGKLKEILSIGDLRQEWQKRRSRMLGDKIDFTAFLFWFIENYPESKDVIENKPEFWERFK